MNDPLFFGYMGAGLVLGISAFGSVLGMGMAGAGTIGAWKRCFKANKRPPMTLLAFVGFPLTEVLYGFILMNQMVPMVTPENSAFFFATGIAAGLAIGLTGYAEGWIGAATADALTETGKGMAGYIAVVGILETVALFSMVLYMQAMVAI
jgi:V/A-type H+-transporting ATPase subunit K